MPVIAMKRHTAASPQSEARTRLAEAIAAETGAASRLAALEQVRARAWEAIATARGHVTAAEEALADTARANAAFSVDLLLGVEREAPLTPTQAKAALDAANDTLTACRAAHQTIETEIETLTAAAGWRKSRIDTAAAVVMAEEACPAIQALMVELNDLHAQVVDKARCLENLIHHNVVKAIGPGATPGVLELQCRATSPATGWLPWSRPDPSPTGAAWLATLEILKSDPAAPAVPLGLK